MEDLRNWKPLENTEYNGYERRDRHGQTKRAYTIIYFRKDANSDSLDEYYGGFDIINNQVKIWYTLNGQKTQKVVPRSICEFSKTRAGHTTYYHLIISENTKKGAIMSENNKLENEDNEKEYGLRNKDNVDEKVEFKVRPEKAGIIERITGRSSAIYQKKRHEDKLNEIWKEFDNTIQKIDKQDEELKKAYTNIPSLEKTLKNTEKEWSEMLTSLGNLINKKTDHEKGMWEITQNNRKNRSMKIKQKFIRAGVDEMNFNSMQDYIKQYPELQSSGIIEKAVDKADEKRKEVIEAQKELDRTISTYNLLLNTFEKLTREAQDNLETFEELIKEADDKVNNSPYNKSKLWGKVLTTAYEQEATRLDLLPYKGKLKVRRSDLERVKDELSDYKRKHFVDKESIK